MFDKIAREEGGGEGWKRFLQDARFFATESQRRAELRTEDGGRELATDGHGCRPWWEMDSEHPFRIAGIFRHFRELIASEG